MADADIVKRRYDDLMFVDYVKIVEGAEHFVPSVLWPVRLQGPDELKDIRGGYLDLVSYFSANFGVKAGRILAERKIGPPLGIPARLADVADHDVQRGPQIVDRVTDDQREVGRDILPDFHGDDSQSPFRIVLNDKGTRVSRKEGVDGRLKLKDVAFGPLNL